MALQLRRLGSSGPVVTPLGLGLAALGRPGYLNMGHAADIGDTSVLAMRDRCHAVLDAAWDAGIRYVDVARSYGRAEEFLAGWLADAGRPIGAMTVGSKWGYVYTAGWRVEAEHHEIKDHSAANLRRQLVETRCLLDGHLSLYQVHSATLDSGILDDDEVLDELAKVRDRGIVVGLSLSGPRQAETLERAMTVRRAGERLFATVQATWNVLEPSCGPALAAAHDAGMGVIVKEALANGRLTPADPAAPVPMEAALGAALAQPWADVVLSGASTVTQLCSHVAALREPAPEIDPAIAEAPEDYWRTRAQLPWT